MTEDSIKVPANGGIEQRDRRVSAAQWVVIQVGLCMVALGEFVLLNKPTATFGTGLLVATMADYLVRGDLAAPLAARFHAWVSRHWGRLMIVTVAFCLVCVIYGAVN